MTDTADTVKHAAGGVAARARQTRSRARRAAVSQERAYAGGDDRPLRAYLALLAVYGITSAGLGGLLLRNRRRLPRAFDPGDLALLAVASFKLSRILSRDSVTSPLRAPFTRYRGSADGPAEVQEDVRGRGARKAIGELLTCPFCLGQWTATAFMAGHLIAPRVTRVAAGTLTVAAGADALQLAHAAATKGSE